MACATVSVLVYVSSENKRWNQFLTPIVKLFVIPAGGPSRSQLITLGLLPLLVGWITWNQVIPRTGTPTVIRVQHPALPDQFAAMENPFANVSAEERSALEREGLVLYQKNCRPCHGTRADGAGPLARGQRLQPIDFTDPGTIGTVVEPHPYWRIQEGSLGLPPIATPWESAMPPWGDELTADEIWKIIMAEYRLSGTEPREPEELGG
jgi:mono/diheme cytochrome c family protein